MAKKTSPTQRSLALLRQTCQLVEVTERWNPFAKIRQDLFSIVDILCIRDGETLAVQTTSGPNVSARIAKIAESDAIAFLRKAGWRFEVHGWRKVKPRGETKPRWECRIVDIS